jgi:hypothetical protein
VPDLLIQLTRRADGGTVRRCVRADGSATWQRQEGRQAAFFPHHDLSHYAVESELGFRSGFYGLIAEGWELEETGGKGDRGTLPVEAVAVEHLAGVLDLERAGGVEWTAADVNRHAAAFAASGGRPPPRAVTDAELARVRARVLELFARWRGLPPGATLELSFDRAR